ncbi:MAG: hypothetical protein ACLGIF_04685 [Actinomycetes bacterium]
MSEPIADEGAGSMETSYEADVDASYDGDESQGGVAGTSDVEAGVGPTTSHADDVASGYDDDVPEEQQPNGV